MAQRYNVTLDPELVEEARVYQQDFGGKLSTLLNRLLEVWLEEKKKQKV